jgi:hypothetical protein
MEFEIGPRVSTVENRVMRSSGWQDFTNNRKAAMSIYDDATVRGTAETTTYSITHYNNVSGVFTEIISGYASSPVAGQFTYNPTLFNASYEIRYKAFSA